MLTGLVQQFVEPFVNSSRAFVVLGFKLKSLLLILALFSSPKATDAHRETGLSGDNMLARYIVV